MSEWLESLAGLIPEEVLEQARALVDQGGEPGEFLLGRKDVPAGRVLAALSRHHGLPALLLATYHPEQEALERVPEELSRRFSIFPLFLHKDRIFIATAEPWELSVEDFVRRKTGLTMEPVVALRSDIERAINRFYLTGDKTARKVQALSGQAADSPRPEPAAPAFTPMEDPDAPSIKLASHILSTGIRLGASDIHLEPFEDRVSLRYRLDGILREHPAPPLELLRAVTSRLKILANLDVSERRLPQDGRITTVVDGRDYDLRVSIIPNLFGESVVIRILASRAEIQDLQALGFAPEMMERYLRLISRPHGVVLVTGPTGSGKSTTLYASLQKLYTPEKKILTLEDPVESRMAGITQFQMTPPVPTGRDRHPGFADRTSPALHPAHQRRRLGPDAADRHGGPRIPGHDLAPGSSGPAPAAAPVPALPATLPGRTGAPPSPGSGSPAARGHALPAGGMRRVPEPGLPGSGGRLRAAGDLPRDAPRPRGRADLGEAVGAGGHAGLRLVAPERRGPLAGGPDQLRGSHEDHGRIAARLATGRVSEGRLGEFRFPDMRRIV
jgi:energy-coupling factor transporter ATP-binding protein EcfA2